MSEGFFRSRWVDAPEHVTEAEPSALPLGFRAAGVAAGIKPAGLDLGLLVSDEPGTTSAARFTTNARVGAPVMASRLADLQGLRAVVANSGCSNVGDGQRGFDTATAMQARAAERLGIEPAQVGVASTGVIGLELPRDTVLAGIEAAAGELGEDAGGFSRGDPHQRQRAQARLPRGRPALGPRAPGRPGQGGGHDLAALRHDVLLRADRRARGRRTPSTCSPACASSARSTGSRSTASCPPATPSSPWPTGAPG